MRINIANMNNLYTNAPTYNDGLMLVWSGIDQNDFDSINMKIRRIIKDSSGLSYLLVLSTHESKGAYKEKCNTGKAGRPITIVKGEQAVKHCHGLIISENTDIDINKTKKDLTSFCRKKRKRKPYLKQQKIKKVWNDGLPITRYMCNQADKIRRGGSFDFDYYMTEEYAKSYEWFGKHK